MCEALFYRFEYRSLALYPTDIYIYEMIVVSKVRRGTFRAKMAKYHFFGNFWQKNTVSEINGKVPLFLEVEFQKLEFLVSSATVALLSWNVRLKKIMWYSSLVNSSTMQHSTRVYQARIPLIKKKNYTVLEFGKPKYCVIFFLFFFFWHNQQINIKIKISSLFFLCFYLFK